jgi:hypothetical protein
MALVFKRRRRPAQTIAAWRRARLEKAGFDAPLARELADGRVDLNELINLVESGCPPGLAARILAPLEPAPPPR